MSLSLSENITSLRTLLDTAETEIKSLEGGRKASSSRARLSLQKIKQNCHMLRKDITTHTKALPTKSRATKKVESEPVESEPVEDPVAVKKTRKPRKKTVVVSDSE
jgi:hypothetical protein